MGKASPNYYAVIPASVRYDPDLSDKAKLLYGEITTLCNKRGECWAQNDYFAGLYEVSAETISRSIKALEDAGYIRVDYQKRGAQVVKRTIFIQASRLTKSATDEPQKTQPSIDEKRNRTVDENVKENNTSINNLNINNIPPISPTGEKGENELFERFWAAYPKHRAKADAVKAFSRLKVDGPFLAVLLNALEKQKQSKDWRKDNGTFIPYPSTWLNGKRWLDELEPEEEETEWHFSN